MKRILLISALLPLLVAGCYPMTSVTVTQVPTSANSFNYNYGYNYNMGMDLCQNLDLQVIAGAFAQSSSIREFEILLNDSARYFSNLDLNRDGYVDYLRVVETRQHGVHVFLVQAVLGYNTFQDVASIIVENPTWSSWRIEVVGNPYIYGNNYVISPVFRTRPFILSHFSGHNYQCWSSPYRWGCYPDRYRHQSPLVINSYQRYVNNYMVTNVYCREVHYPSGCHYPDHASISRGCSRNDYESAYPDKSFSSRTANLATTNSASARAASAQRINNAGDIRRIQDASSASTAATRSASANTGSTRTSATSGSRSATTTSSSRSGSTSRSSSSASKPAATSSVSSSSSSSKSGSRSAATTSGSRSGSSTSTSRSATTTSSSRSSSTSRSSGSSNSASRSTSSSRSSR